MTPGIHKSMLLAQPEQSTKGVGDNLVPHHSGPQIIPEPEAPSLDYKSFRIPDSQINDEDLYLYADSRGAKFFPTQTLKGAV